MISSSSDNLKSELEHLNDVFDVKNYSKPFVESVPHVLTKVKDPSPINSRAGAVYKIPCAECPASYVGETGRTLECRIKKYKRSIANEYTRNNIAAIKCQLNTK